MSVSKAAERLDCAIDLEVVRGERLAQRTSYRIGGPAELTVTVIIYLSSQHNTIFGPFLIFL